jgi:hypothetical protein
MQIYDFDRCTGELSNFRELDFSGFIPYPPYDFTPFVLSPDASKIYMGRSNLTQTNYETIQVDVETGQMNVVSDSVFVPLLTPNLKWVISAYQDTFFTYIDDLSVIKEPNNSALNINRTYINNCFEVNAAIQEPIEYANHLLGPIDGSSCDTLGLDDETSIKKLEQFSFNVFPNPGNEIIQFTADIPLPLKLTIRDNQGRTVIEKLFSQKSFSIQEGIAELNAGIYFVELKSEKKPNRLVKKWMKMQ